MRLVNCPSRIYSDRDFCMSAPEGSAEAFNFPVIAIVNNAVTKRMDRQVKVENGAIIPEEKEGILKLSVIGPDSSVTSGLVYGFGDSIGGLATSLGVYNNKLLIVGNNNHDMAFATNRMLDLDGGIVLVQDGKIISEVSLPIAGTQPKEDIKTFASQMKQVRKDLKKLECFLEDPFYTIHFLTMSGLPYLRILPGGILDVVKKEFVFSTTK